MAKTKPATDWAMNRDDVPTSTPAPRSARPRPVAVVDDGDTFVRHGIGLRKSQLDRARAIAAATEVSVNAVLVHALTVFIEQYDAGPGKVEILKRRKTKHTM